MLCAAAYGAGFGVGSAEGGGGRQLLDLGLTAHGFGDHDLAWLWQLQLLPGYDGN